MRWAIVIMAGVGILALAGLGFLVWTFDPYQAGIGIKALFFSMLVLLAISVVTIPIIMLKRK